MVNNRLSADDWINAALQGLLADGPGAVAVQPLARALGATKGSFYWHFSSRADLLRGALDRWLAVATDDLIAAVEATDEDPAGKVRLFARRLAEHTIANPGELHLAEGSAAAADGAGGDGGGDQTRAALETAANRRVAYFARLLRAAGHARGPAQRRATNAYTACLGHAQLANAAPRALPASVRGRRDLLDEAIDLLLA